MWQPPIDGDCLPAARMSPSSCSTLRIFIYSCNSFFYVCRRAPFSLIMQDGGRSPHENNGHVDLGLSASIEAEHGAAARPMWVSHDPRPRMHAGVTTGWQANVLPELAPSRRIVTSEGRPLNVPDRARIQPVNVPDSDDDSDTRVDLDSWWDLDSGGILGLPSRVTEEDLTITYRSISALWSYGWPCHCIPS
ncbi:unnamed protein product [Cuscuta europaea]|uniref:Uncharacterized protein n=1 Tax=Cuscuta europaea TaxID=41803 RepID=A0A9P0ZFT8_CUSEU|nr:unnamed protein product [Cuscuta europaea]